MSVGERPSASGLTAVELALLRAVEECDPSTTEGFVPTTEVLDRVDTATGVGPRYGIRIVRDLVANWTRHLPLLEGEGNFGSIAGDEGADAQYTEVRLSAVGQLAMASERGDVGPLPLDLIEGSLYRGGGFPPFDPATTIRSLLVGSDRVGGPRTPTGTITLDPNGTFRRNGRWRQRFQLGSVIRIGAANDKLVITEPPYLVPLDTIVATLHDRIRQAEGERNRQDSSHADYLPDLSPDHPPALPPEDVPLLDVLDVTSGRTGPRVVLHLNKGVDLIEALDWVRSVWPVTVHVDCVSYEETYDRFAGWRDLDKSGLEALGRVVTEERPGPDDDIP